MFNSLLKDYCFPTLLGLKVANMFSYSYISKQDLDDTISSWNKFLNEKSIHIEILNITDRRALIYVYRKKRLMNILNQKKVKNILCEYGYKTNKIDDCMSTLKNKIKSSEDFPHEIGVFLGYPICDVLCFIKDKGKNSICTGCWKVYHNEERALKTFSLFDRCRKISKKINKSDAKTIIKLVDNNKLLKYLVNKQS